MPHTIEYYRSKGFDEKTARYFASGRKRAVSVCPNEDFTLTIGFDNGETRIYDVKPLLKKDTVFEPFMNMDNFMRVYLDEQHNVAWDIDPAVDSNVIWNNKVDLCADSCYMDSKRVSEDNSR